MMDESIEWMNASLNVASIPDEIQDEFLDMKNDFGS